MWQSVGLQVSLDLSITCLMAFHHVRGAITPTHVGVRSHYLHATIQFERFRVVNALHHAEQHHLSSSIDHPHRWIGK